jgi:hypothetical protein
MQQVPDVVQERCYHDRRRGLLLHSQGRGLQGVLKLSDGLATIFGAAVRLEQADDFVGDGLCGRRCVHGFSSRDLHRAFRTHP